MQKIDIEPTWASLKSLYAEWIDKGTNDQKQIVKDDLGKLTDLADIVRQSQKNNQPIAFYPDGTFKPIKTYRHPKSKVTKYRKHNKKEILGHDKTYNTDVTYEESKKVRNAIMNTEKDYIPTTNNIIKETGLPIHRVRATIHLLKKRGVIKSRIGNDLQPIHKLVLEEKN